MTILSPILTSITPFLPLLVPGVLLVRQPKNFTEALAATTRILLWSYTTTTLITLTTTSLHIPVRYILPSLCVIALGYLLWRYRSITSTGIFWALFVFTLTLVLVAAFAIPYLLLHDGLPSGDIQKSILWAIDSIEHNRLPNYQFSPQLLNRDPVDFYTPGLHSLTAALLTISPNPLISAGIFSITLAVAVTLISAGISLYMVPKKYHPFAALVTIGIILTNLRFLRYLREPGYHYQNIAGELLLFGMLFILISLFHKWRRSDALLGVIVIITLGLTHQFSAFISIFLVVPLTILLIVHRRFAIAKSIGDNPKIYILASIAFFTFISAGFSLGLHQKIPHIFTTEPHLLHLTLSFREYPDILGSVWFLLACSGIAYMSYQGIRRGQLTLQALSLTCFILLLLSQGPRIGIDIPPIRALWYTIVPLSLAITHLLVSVCQYSKKLCVALLLIMAIGGYSSLARAFEISHTPSTNSTFRPAYYHLINAIRTYSQQSTNAVLVDDYNRRAASWLVLSKQPMYTRISADIARQMDEAKQSDIRFQLYINQLDYEKIFSLGSRPEISQLMQKHTIQFLTGIENSSSTSFQYNPILQEIARGEDITIFIEKDSTSSEQSEQEKLPPHITQWLLRSSTLANDIGDREDTFKQLPASIRATRLSDPQRQQHTTFRSTTAPIIPLTFNVGDYVALLWDKEHTNQPDISLEFFLQLHQLPPSGISFQTPTGNTYPISKTMSMIKIPANQLSFDEDGFITLYVQNPNQETVAIDLIALGLSHTP